MDLLFVAIANCKNTLLSTNHYVLCTVFMHINSLVFNLGSGEYWYFGDKPLGSLHNLEYLLLSIHFFNLPSPFSFFSSQYRNRLLTIIIRGMIFHFSSIILDKQSSTPCISLLPFTSIHTIDGAELIRDVSHRVRMAVISFDINTSPRANLHFGYL